jgi:translation elongation factor EF-1beta
MDREHNVFALTDRLADVDINIDQLNDEINNNKANRAEINDMRTNFTQRSGSILVGKLFIKTKWVNDRIKPTDAEVDKFVDDFSTMAKEIGRAHV